MYRNNMQPLTLIKLLIALFKNQSTVEKFKIWDQKKPQIN